MHQHEYEHDYDLKLNLTFGAWFGETPEVEPQYGINSSYYRYLVVGWGVSDSWLWHGLRITWDSRYHSDHHIDPVAAGQAVEAQDVRSGRGRDHPSPRLRLGGQARPSRFLTEGRKSGDALSSLELNRMLPAALPRKSDLRSTDQRCYCSRALPRSRACLPR